MGADLPTMFEQMLKFLSLKDESPGSLLEEA